MPLLWAPLLPTPRISHTLQAIKDDIGDKSVFEFMKLSPEQQEERLRGEL